MCVSALIKGMGAGMMVGAMVYICCEKKSCGRKNKISRAIKSISSVVEDVTEAMGL